MAEPSFEILTTFSNSQVNVLGLFVVSPHLPAERSLCTIVLNTQRQKQLSDAPGISEGFQGSHQPSAAAMLSPGSSPWEFISDALVMTTVDWGSLQLLSWSPHVSRLHQAPHWGSVLSMRSWRQGQMR